MIDINIFLQICAGIVCMGGALGYLFRGFTFIKKPADEVSKKLKDHDTFLANDKVKLESLEKVICENTECLKLLVEVMYVVLEHFEDGNHTKELSVQRKKIETYLLGRMQ